jgi:hypothetical protein
MSKLPIIVLSVSAVLIGCALASQAPLTSPALFTGQNDVVCIIHAARDGNAVSLKAVALAKRNVSGTYRFSVQKAGGGGDSDIEQGGSFSLRQDAESVLGDVAVGGDQAAHYAVNLKLEWPGGGASCSRASS